MLDVRLHYTGGLHIRAYHYPRQRLYRLLMDSTGNIWCATNTGLKMFAAGYISAIELPAPFSLSELTAMTCDGDTEMWFAQKGKLYNISLVDENPQPKLMYSSPSSITHLYCDGSDVLWVGTFGDGLWYSADHRNFRKVTGITPLDKENVLDISGRDNKLWIAGLNGVEELQVRNNNELTLVKLHNKGTGIGSDYVYEIFPDRNGNTWMATDGAGVCMYSNGKYTLWDSASGMTSNVAYNIAGDTRGRIWASTFNKGLLVYNGRRWENIGAEQGLQSMRISAITPTSYGTMLVVHA
ncbi:MAG: hypothetical protein K8I82_10740, partial [Anaerolineae bacterium]|nr:hypothetical protein [Anaerolineae bacterium]